MVIGELLRHVRSSLTDNADFEARQIVMRALNMSAADLTVKSREEADEGAVLEAKRLLERRKRGEPLQYILKTAEFMSLEFEVTRDTLIPRSDTETLVEYLLDEIKEGESLLDIGTGSGCIGISAAHYAKAEITLLDISGKALEVAARNAAKNGVSAEFLNIDILKDYPKRKFDVVVSNPPYIETDVIKTLQTEVKDYEPLTALDGGADGLTFYRRIIEIAPKILNKNGLLAFEIGYNQAKAVSELMRADFSGVRVIKDLCGNDRVVSGRMDGKKK